MINKQKAILIISTDATRTGTPVLLLNMLQWLKINSKHKYVLLLQEGGELLEDFKSVCDVFIWKDAFKMRKSLKKSFKYFRFRFFKKFLSFDKDLNISFKQEEANVKLFIDELFSSYNFQLVISNTARNGHILNCFREDQKSKLLLYVHEGERTLDLFNQQGFVTYNLNISKRIIAVSESIKKMLQVKYNIKGNIDVVNGGIDVSYTFYENSRYLLNNFGIPDDAIIIMSSGWLDWLKGIDIFIQIASILAKQNHKLHFIWLGGSKDDQGYRDMQLDIRKLQLENRVSIIPSIANPLDYFNLSDIFLMLSREESLSLVTIEAGLAKKPVLCFDKTGGPNEIVDFDSRFIVQYADINAMCERIMDLVNNESERKKMGEYMYDRVINNYTIEKNAAHFLSLINQELSD